MNALLDRPRLRARADGLDLLRFALALYVILSHLTAWTGTPLSGAWEWLTRAFQAHGETNPAVIGFIVLSGYCIHRNGARRDWSVRPYAVKRAFRILPVYGLAVLAGVVLFAAAARISPAASGMAGIAQPTVGGLLAKLALISPVLPLSHLYASTYQGNAPLSTVAAEVWLYAFYAGAMWLLIRRRISERSLWLAVAALTLAGLALVGAEPGLRAWWFNGSVFGFLALWWLGAWMVGRRPSWQLALLAGGVWAAASMVDGSVAGQEVRILALGLLAGVGIVCLDRYVRRLPAWLAATGRSGYSLYAFHGPLLILLVCLGVPWPLVLAAAILLGLVSFRAVERPFIEKGRQVAALLDDDRRVLGADGVPVWPECQHKPAGVVKAPAGSQR